MCIMENFSLLDDDGRLDGDPTGSAAVPLIVSFVLTPIALGVIGVLTALGSFIDVSGCLSLRC